jgi:hypothetical protein
MDFTVIWWEAALLYHDELCITQKYKLSKFILILKGRSPFRNLVDFKNSIQNPAAASLLRGGTNIIKILLFVGNLLDLNVLPDLFN